MKIKDLIHRARMQIGDTSKLDITDYQLLELYNHGNQIVAHLVAKYVPSMARKKVMSVINEYSRPPDVLFAKSLTVDGVESDKGIESISLNDGKEHTIRFEYVPSTGYKDMAEESGYISEIESMLVEYMVNKVIKAPFSLAEWEMFFINLGTSDNSVVMRKGYWENEYRGTDYSDKS